MKEWKGACGVAWIPLATVAYGTVPTYVVGGSQDLGLNSLSRQGTWDCLGK